MSRGVRSLVGLLVGLFTVVLTGISSAAYATVGPPDHTGAAGGGVSGHVSQSASTAGLSAWAVLLIAFGAVALGIVVTELAHGIRRHRPTSRPATA